jgi:hypothetical protein
LAAAACVAAAEAHPTLNALDGLFPEAHAVVNAPAIL